MAKKPSIPNLEARVAFLKKKYGPVVIVHGNSVSFRPRRMYQDQTPWEFYADNAPAYEDLTRWQLSVFDFGLYRSLARTDMLQYAVPSDRDYKGAGRRLTQSQIDEILKAHKTYKGVALEASKHLPYSLTTIWRHWRKNGLSKGRSHK